MFARKSILPKNHFHSFPFKSHNFSLIASYTRGEYGKCYQKVFHLVAAAANACTFPKIQIHAMPCHSSC